MRAARAIRILVAGWVLLTSCSLLHTSQLIAVPSGCGDCHRDRISANWTLVYRPVDLADETGRVPWRRPESTVVAGAGSGEQELMAQRCFHCHLAPDAAHRDSSGFYHP